MTTKAEQAKKISQNIKELRGDIGWNQAKLAAEADITAAALSKIEQGEDRVPTVVVLRKLANALGVQVHEITGEQPADPQIMDERNKHFYRKFRSLEDLDEHDQDLLLGMAERLKDINKK